MPFDLTTAQPVNKASGGFDRSTAKPSRAPKPSPARAAEGERRIKELDTERAALARRSEEEQSLGGRVTGTVKDIGQRFADSNYGLDYLKDYGSGIATALERTNEVPVGPGDTLLGVGAPAISYPLAMGAGALAAPFSGDYGGVRDVAFENMNDTLPEGAKAAQGAVGAILKPVGDLIHTAGRGIGELAALPFDEPGTQEGVRRNVGDVAEDVIGLAGVKSKAPVGTPGLKPGPPKRAPVTPGPTADPVARARDAGYTIAPSARTAEGKSAAPIGGVAEGASGRTQMQHRVDQKNDQRVLSGIRKDLGIGEKTQITQPVIDAILEETGLAYKGVSDAMPVLQKTEKLDAAIADIGARRKANPLLEEAPRVAKLRRRGTDAGAMKTEDVMSAVQEFRDTARKIREGAASAEKPEVQMQMASAYREMADALEAGLDDSLTQAGRADLIPALKNARQKRAKAYQAFEAVSGKKRPGVALMDMKLNGEMLSGEMDLAADVMRDMSPNGPLHVNMARGQGNAQGDVTSILQGAVRPIIQPVLASEFGQRRMFGPRVPESLSPYDPKQFDVPPANPTIMDQGDAFGGPLEFEPGPGSAGGAMPSDVRRLNTTIADQLESQGPNADLALPPGIAGGQMPTDARRLARTTEQQNQIRMQDFDLEAPEGVVGGRGRAAPLTERELLDLELGGGFAEFDATQPFNRRTNTEPYTGIERRVNGVPDLTAERQRVLDRPIGTPPNVGMADDLLNDTGIRRAVIEDTRTNRAQLNPGDALPVGAGFDRGPPTQGPEVSQFGEFERRRNVPDEPISGFGPVRSNAGIGEMIGNERVRPGQGEITFTADDLAALGFTPEEIAQLLGEG